jgi:hypothetical protein
MSDSPRPRKESVKRKHASSTSVHKSKRASLIEERSDHEEQENISDADDPPSAPVAPRKKAKAQLKLAVSPSPAAKKSLHKKASESASERRPREASKSMIEEDGHEEEEEEDHKSHHEGEEDKESKSAGKDTDKDGDKDGEQEQCNQVVAKLEKDVKKANQMLDLFKQQQTVSKYASMPVQVQYMDKNGMKNPLPFMRQVVANATDLIGMMNEGKVLTNCIHTALLLNSVYWGNKVHPFEIEANLANLQVVRTSDEVKYFDKNEKDPTKAQKTKKVDSYINVGFKRPQSWGGNVLFLGLHCITPFHRTPGFTKWGPTKELGVEGSYLRVKDVKAGPTSARDADYGMQMDNSVFTECSVDDNDDDAVSSWFLSTFVKGRMFKTIVEKALAIKETFLYFRSEMANEFKKMKKPVPETFDKQADWIMEKFRLKHEPIEGNTTGFLLKMSESVHRSVKCKWENGEKHVSEDLSGYVPPSPMFALQESQVHKKGHLIVHNRIPMIRYRSLEEFDPAIAALPKSDPRAYKGAYIPIPFENASLQGSNNVVSYLTKVSIYDYIDKECGGTTKLAGIAWLNTASDLARQTQEGIQPVDPRFCMPGAGLYWGPADEAKKMQAIRDQEAAAYKEHQQAQQEQAEPTDEELLAAEQLNSAD